MNEFRKKPHAFLLKKFSNCSLSCTTYLQVAEERLIPVGPARPPVPAGAATRGATSTQVIGQEGKILDRVWQVFGQPTPSAGANAGDQSGTEAIVGNQGTVNT